MAHGYVRLVLLMGASLAAAAQTVYYVHPAGDDGRSGTNPSEAWRTLARARAAIRDGVEIRLARDGVFEGSLAIANITGFVLGAYGEGAAPIVSGFALLRDWQDLGGGRWRAHCRECASALPFITRDGVTLPVARWPNPDEGDGGYLYYESADGRTSISDQRLAGGPDWTGAEAVLRSAAWILDRLPVTAHDGARLTFGAPATYAIPRGYGYFLQNHLAALDRDGEWVFDPAQRTVTVQLESTTPADHEFAAAVTETLVSVTNSQRVEIRGVALLGARRANLEIRQSTRVTLSEVESLQAGDTGIRCIDCRELRIENSRISGALNHGLDIFNCTDCRVERTRILDTALLAGMGRSGNGQYNGVRFGGVNAVFSGNEVARTGYLGIDVRGAATIENNVVSQANLVKTDGGGIYTWGNRDVTIAGNLVLDSHGFKSGVPWNNPATHGIYIDDQCEDVRVTGNTVVDVGTHGIYLHNTRNVVVERNTIVGADESQIAYIDDHLGSHTVSETTVRDNVFVSRRAGPMMARASTNAGPEFFTSIGEMSGNLYCSPFAEPVFGTSLPAQARVFRDQWRRIMGTDTDARFCPQRLPLFDVRGAAGPDRVTNGRFDTGISGWFGWPAESLQASWDDGRLRLRHTASAPIIHYDHPIGAIEKGRVYRIRFDAQSDQPDRLLRVYLRKWDPDYRYLGAVADLPLGVEPRSHEVVVAATESEARSLLIFELPNASQVVWLDNVRLEPVDAAPVDPSTSLHVEVNPSDDPRTIGLDRDWTGLDGSLLPAGLTLTLPSRGAVVLLRP